MYCRESDALHFQELIGVPAGIAVPIQVGLGTNSLDQLMKGEVENDEGAADA